MNNSHEELVQHIEHDLLDSYDEELELEIDDRDPTDRVDRLDSAGSATDKQARLTYFRELFRLQGELVKLQDWVANEKQKVVILFEGRDAAGKGCVIKRITQRLNPRICRVVACLRPTTANAPSGTSSATLLNCPQPARWCCSTAAGTTAPAWKK